jgi:2,3-dihydroxybiphenyl 1,2-dioxygenase
MRGVAQLGYLGFAVADLDAWERFAVDVLGLVVAARDAGGAFTLRMDGHAQRFFVDRGGDDVAFIGWEAPDAATLDELADRLRAAGHDVEAAPGDGRRVDRLIRFRDPAGIPTEIYCGPALAAEPFRSPVTRSGFVADDQGLGHVVVSTIDKQESVRFYRDLLGFRLSDHIVTEFWGHAVDLSFFHANRRHHSIALGDRQRKRIHHFMIEARSMDDVGLAFDRALRAGVKIVQTLGRHPNDRMFSFYAKTPSGFQFEYGWGGREVDDAAWQPATYDRISEWGHHPPMAFAPPEKK